MHLLFTAYWGILSTMVYNYSFFRTSSAVTNFENGIYLACIAKLLPNNIETPVAYTIGYFKSVSGSRKLIDEEIEVSFGLLVSLSNRAKISLFTTSQKLVSTIHFYV